MIHVGVIVGGWSLSHERDIKGVSLLYLSIKCCFSGGLATAETYAAQSLAGNHKRGGGDRAGHACLHQAAANST